MSNIVKETMLIKVSLKDNNNKFYRVVLYENGDLSTHWGRVGSKGSGSFSRNCNEHAFNNIVSEKRVEVINKLMLL